MNRSNILYIDDEKQNLIGFKFDFQRYYNVYTSENTHEAIEIIKKNQISVVICDYRMPGKTGAVFFQELAVDFPDIIRILITAYSDVKLIIDAVNLGQIYHFINKPYDISQLKNIIDKAIEAYNLKKQNEVLIHSLKTRNEELSDSFAKILEINAELKKAKEKAEESDKLKSAFLANISHEIRSPMNGILGFINLLKEAPVEADERKFYLDTVALNCNQLLDVINDIVDISIIDAGLVELYIENFSIDQLLAELHKFYLPLAKNSGLEIELAKSNNQTEYFFKTDKTKIKQTFNKLLSNSIKFTKNGIIKFGYVLKDDEFEFFVSDTGIGISESEQKIIFDSFRQAVTGNNRKYSGTGLGLAIAKAYVTKLGGKIWVKAEPEKGSTFFFTIPKHNGLSDNIKNKETELINYDECPVVLLVEDEEANSAFLKRILSRYKLKIIHAKTGIEAVEYCEKNIEINLVLMDIKLPEMDGYEATAKIKSLRKGIYIIAQTAYALSGDRAKILNAGCDDYISKPFDKEKLFEMIEKYIPLEKIK